MPFPVGKLALILVLGGLVAAGLNANAGSAQPPAGKAAAAKLYHCPMHPQYTSDRPGDCPICGMKLTLITPDAAAGQAVQAATGAAVPGRVAISISPDKQHLIGLRAAKAVQRDLTQTVRATGVIEHDETKYARIAPRFSGWVRRLKVNYTGQTVEKGQPLLTVYSPELFATEAEYLMALKQAGQWQDKPPTEPALAARRLLETARQRLKLWEIGDEEIRALEQRSEPADELLLRAPVSGHVVAKTAIEGKAFMAGETLYEIGDLAHLWVRAAIFDSDLPRIKVGQKARVILPCLDYKAYASAVTFIYPHMDPQTRRAEVRLELDNPAGELRPDMWANVEIEASLGRALTVPASAVIDTGTRFVAFVRKEGNRLEPRELKIGAKTDDFYQVLAGVEAGEQVVTRALFLVDAESQLKAAIAGMSEAGAHEH